MLRKKFTTLKVLLSTFLIVSLVYYHYRQAPVAEPKERTIQYVLQVKNTTGELIDNSKISVFAPVRRTSWQETIQVSANAPHDLVQDELGNQSLEFIISLPPYGNKQFTVRAQVVLLTVPSELPVKKLSQFLKEERYVELKDKRLQALSRSMTRERIPDSDAAFEWVSRNIRDIGYTKANYGARHAFDKRGGDCTEFSYLFIALTRLKKIPARLIGGFVLDERGALRPENFHNWAEFMENGVWMIADPYRKVMREQAEGYVAFRIFNVEGAADNAQRFLAFDKRLEISLR